MEKNLYDVTSRRSYFTMVESLVEAKPSEKWPSPIPPVTY
jgi:hypothetical protein